MDRHAFLEYEEEVRQRSANLPWTRNEMPAGVPASDCMRPAIDAGLRLTRENFGRRFGDQHIVRTFGGLYCLNESIRSVPSLQMRTSGTR